MGEHIYYYGMFLFLIFFFFDFCLVNMHIYKWDVSFFYNNNIHIYYSRFSDSEIYLKKKEEKCQGLN